MSEVLSVISGAGGAIVAVVLLLAALLFVPWSEPARRAEALLRAWKGEPASPAPPPRTRRRTPAKTAGPAHGTVDPSTTPRRGTVRDSGTGPSAQ